jgi:hypothetical protein
MEAMYRKGGPEKGRFDFTPAFYAANCGRAALPTPFAQECQLLMSEYEKIAKTNIYCPHDPTARGCTDVIKKAEAQKAADKNIYDECRVNSMAFNKKYAADRAKQRSEDCAYEVLRTGGPNRYHQTWPRLMPAACQAGAYVDSDGLDCCDETTMSAAAFSGCSMYMLPRN